MHVVPFSSVPTPSAHPSILPVSIGSSVKRSSSSECPTFRGDAKEISGWNKDTDTLLRSQVLDEEKMTARTKQYKQQVVGASSTSSETQEEGGSPSPSPSASPSESPSESDSGGISTKWGILIIFALPIAVFTYACPMVTYAKYNECVKNKREGVGGGEGATNPSRQAATHVNNPEEASAV